MTFFVGDLPIVATALALSILLVGLNYYGTGEAGLLQDVIVVRCSP